MVNGEQPASVCAKDNVPVPGGSGPSGGTVRNEAVRVEDPALQVSHKANDTTPGVNDGSSLSASAAGSQITQRKQLRLEKYDGSSTPLETFLAKYDNCVKYNRWSAEERAVFLRDSLNGNASQVLWETSGDASAEEIIRLLRNRFGSSNQMERYRAELHARRRMRGKSAQVLYQDIKRLLALGFPGQSGVRNHRARRISHGLGGPRPPCSCIGPKPAYTRRGVIHRYSYGGVWSEQSYR